MGIHYDFGPLPPENKRPAAVEALMAHLQKAKPTPELRFELKERPIEVFQLWVGGIHLATMFKGQPLLSGESKLRIFKQGQNFGYEDADCNLADRKTILALFDRHE